jgi:hypothetical protein
VSLADFLGSLPAQVDMGADVAPALAGPSVTLPSINFQQQQPQPQAEAPHGLHALLNGTGGLFGGAIGNVLGRIGDALLVANGQQPMYAPRQQSRRLSQALSNYLGNMEPGMADIFAADPETGLALYKAQHPSTETPAALKEFEYYKGLQGPDRSSYEQFLKLTHPGMMSPITLGPNDSYDDGSHAAGETTATNPQTGEKVRFNPSTGAWEPMGGATASTPSPTFPGR